MANPEKAPEISPVGPPPNLEELLEKVRHDRLEYHKWITSLAVFLLTVSLPAAVALKKEIGDRVGYFVGGWGLLAATILLNVILVNGYKNWREAILRVSDGETLDSAWFRRYLVHQKRRIIYDVGQKWTFILGAGLVAVGFLVAFI